MCTASGVMRFDAAARERTHLLVFRLPLKSDNYMMQDGDCTHKSCQSFASAGTGIRLISLPQPTINI